MICTVKVEINSIACDMIFWKKKMQMKTENSSYGFIESVEKYKSVKVP